MSSWDVILPGQDDILPGSASSHEWPDSHSGLIDPSPEWHDSCSEWIALNDFEPPFFLENDGNQDASATESEMGNDADTIEDPYQEDFFAIDRQVAVGEKRVDRCEDRVQEARPATKLRRGEHVKGRTEMQETGRLGQRHWAKKVVELRAEWEAKQVQHFCFCEEFRRQVFLCERLRAKPQRECMLLALQIAVVDDIIRPLLPFNNAHDSLRWSGFIVAAGRSEEFRSRMDTLFPSDCSTTRNNTFRRCGLVASGCWDKAWRGLSPFIYHPTIRSNT